MGCIYKITNSINGKIYIGYTTTKVEIRMRKHKNDDIKYDTVLGRAISKYGWKNFSYEIILEENDKNKLLDLEKYYIKYYQSKLPKGYNMTDGGEAMFGEHNPFYNKKHSKETKQKISQIAKLRVGSKNHFYGKKHSIDSKGKMSISSGKKVVAIKDEIAIKEFPSIQEAGKWCIEKGFTNGKTPQSDISKRCKDGKIAFGYKWRYLGKDVETMVETSRIEDELLFEVQNK